jgi:hypothetical protein
MENEIAKELEEKVAELNGLFRKIHKNKLELKIRIDELYEFSGNDDSIKILSVKLSRTIYSNGIRF